MSAKNIPPTLDKIDKIACKAGALPTPLKGKQKQQKGSWQACYSWYCGSLRSY